MGLKTIAHLLRPLVEFNVDLYCAECVFLWYELSEDGCHVVSNSTEMCFFGDGTPRQPEKTTWTSLSSLRGTNFEAEPETPVKQFTAFEDDALEEPVPELIARWDDQFAYIGVETLLDIHSGDTLDWAIREGILPGQTFLVCASWPKWYRSGWEHIESDFDINFVIVDRLPTDTGLRTLQQLLDEQARGWVLRAEEEVLTKEARRLDVDRMFLSRSHYYATRGWDEMSPPDGIRLTLCTSRVSSDSRRSGWVYLVSGESDRGDSAEAKEKLRDAMTTEFPHVLERLDTLPQRHH